MLPLLSPGPQLTPQLLRGCYRFCCLVNRGTMGVNSLPKTVTRQRRGCDLNPGPSAPESSTLTIRPPSHPQQCSYPKIRGRLITVAEVVGATSCEGLVACLLSDSGSRLQPSVAAVRDVQQRQHCPRTSCFIVCCCSKVKQSRLKYRDI